MDDIVTERIEDQVTEGVTMESFHDVGAMCFDCFDAQIEQSGYFFAQFRSEEHTSELQSQSNLVCRLLLEKKNTTMPDVESSRLALSREGSAKRCADLTRVTRSLYPSIAYRSEPHRF